MRMVGLLVSTKSRMDVPPSSHVGVCVLTGERQFRVITCVVCSNTPPLLLGRGLHMGLVLFFLFYFYLLVRFSFKNNNNKKKSSSVPLSGQDVSSLPGPLFLSFLVVFTLFRCPFSCCCWHHISRVHPLGWVQPAAGMQRPHNKFPPWRKTKKKSLTRRERKKEGLFI